MISADDLAQMCEILRIPVSNAARWTPGEVAWSVLTEPDDHAVTFVDGGFVWQAEDTVVIAVASGADTRAALVDAATVAAVVDDPVLAGPLHEAGFALRTTGPFDRLLTAPVAAMPPPQLGDGFRARSATAHDDLVAVHRVAWRPHDLPFADDHRPTFAADASSGFDAAKLAVVQASPLYDRDLHVVVEAPDGTLAGSCIAWLDEATGVSSIEPLGVAPQHRRRGIAQALCQHAAALTAARGGHTIVIHPRGDDAYPAPRAAYLRAGFTDVGRTGLFVRA